MASIVVVTRFKEAGSGAFANYINYINRNEATRKDNLSKYNLFEDYTEYMDNDEKTVFQGEHNVEKISALFTRNNDKLSSEKKESLKEAFREAEKNGSNMWQTVISFENNYLEKLGIYDSKENELNEKYLIAAARKSIDKMLENEKLENATWSAAIHYNTDNIHIHVAIVEPKPMRERKTYKLWEQNTDGSYKMKEGKNGKKTKIPVLDANGKQKTRTAYVGRFKNKSHMILKRELISELDNNKDAYIEISNIMRGIINDKKENDLLKNKDFQGKIEELYASLKEEKLEIRYWNYNQNSITYLKPKIDEISNFFIEKYHSEDFGKLLVKMENEAEKQETIYGGSSDYVKNKLYDRKNGLYTRLGNAILKELQDYERNKIKQISEAKACNDLFDFGNDMYNPKLGIEMLERFSNTGNTYAQNKLGVIYLKGEVVERDINKALKYFKASKANGNEYGTMMVKAINNKGSGIIGIDSSMKCKRDFYRSLRLLRRSLQKEYINYVNQYEAEQLQYEIANRGKYEYDL